MLVVYVSDDEVIITNSADEVETVRLYFTEGGRNLDEYDREEIKDRAAAVSNRLRIR